MNKVQTMPLIPVLRVWTRIHFILPDRYPKFSFFADTDLDPTYYREMFEGTPTPARYAYTYGIDTVHLHLRGMPTPMG